MMFAVTKPCLLPVCNFFFNLIKAKHKYIVTQLEMNELMKLINKLLIPQFKILVVLHSGILYKSVFLKTMSVNYFISLKVI